MTIFPLPLALVYPLAKGCTPMVFRDLFGLARGWTINVLPDLTASEFSWASAADMLEVPVSR